MEVVIDQEGLRLQALLVRAAVRVGKRMLPRHQSANQSPFLRRNGYSGQPGLRFADLLRRRCDSIDGVERIGRELDLPDAVWLKLGVASRKV